MTAAAESKVPDLVVAITGASGAIYATRLLQVLVSSGRRVHLTISPSGAEVLDHELGIRVDLTKLDPQRLLVSDSVICPVDDMPPGELVYHHFQDFRAGIASGSFPTAAWWFAPARWERWPALPAGSQRT